MRTIRFLLGATLAGLAACGGDANGPNGGPPSGLAACTSAPPFSVAPVPVAAINELAPLGNLNPPGHTFPTDHLYFYPGGPVGNSNPVPVSAPGNVVIHRVGRQTRTGGGLPELVDYTLAFSPCADVDFYFAHVSSLSAALLTEIGAFTSCNPGYRTGGFDYQQCFKEVKIELSAGTLIGGAGGPGEGALDLGGYDRRVAPLAFVDPGRSYGNGTDFGQNHTICPIDYFEPSVRDQLRAKFGGRGRLRTVEPLCGTLMQDVANTAQGRWYFDQTTTDDHHLALVHDNVDPTLGAFSVGTSVPNLPAGVYNFAPSATGPVNLDFNLVKADGQVHCYQPAFGTRHLLVQLTSATTLKIESAAGASCGPSAGWVLSAAAATFNR